VEGGRKMMPLILQPGDVFAVQTPAFFGRLIRIRDKIRSSDYEAIYNHCALIVGDGYQTFESRRRITFYNLERYLGRHIIIARPVTKDFVQIAATKKIVMKYDGKAYPWWRIILHAISPAYARWIHGSGVPVCSELVAEYLYLIGIRHQYFWGTTPDILADEWRHWREYDVIFCGVLTPEHLGLAEEILT